MDLNKAVTDAADQIKTYVRETPLDYSPYFSKLASCNVHFKLENLQYTGSFKLRGAINKLLSLSTDQRVAGCVTASTGNHGAAMAYGLSKLGIKGIIFVPENASSTKINAIKLFGGDVRFFGRDSTETELHAREYANKHNMIYVSPYNDEQIISGQGTVGYELYNQNDQIEAVLVSVGGGGLISGVGGFLKSKSNKIQVIGCMPENSPAMLKCIDAGKIIDCDCKPTLSDGTAGNIEQGAITFDLCRQYVDQYVLVSENEIKQAIRDFMNTHHMLIEGSAGVAIAALEKIQDQIKQKNVGIVICGANISLDTLKTII